MMYDTGNSSTAPESWSGRDPTCHTLGTKKLDVIRQTANTTAITRNLVLNFDILLVFNVVSSTQGPPRQQGGTLKIYTAVSNSWRKRRSFSK